MNLRKGKISTISLDSEIDSKARIFAQKTHRTFSQVIALSLEKFLEGKNEK